MFVKTIFFDLDDTLCDNALATRKCREASVGYLVARFPRHDPANIFAVYDAVVEQEQCLYGLKGLPVCYASGAELRLDRFRKVLAASELPRDLAPTLVQIYAESKIRHLRAFPEVHSVLSQLQGKHALGVITNGFSDLQREELTALGLFQYLEHVFIAQDVGFWKPDERIFLHALKVAGVAAEETLMVGDNPENDVLTPMKLGMKTGLVLRSSQPDWTVKPDILLRDMTALPTLVQ